MQSSDCCPEQVKVYAAFYERPKLPAILAYHGQAYKHLKAETLTVNYSQGKLWITSFLYGLLRPLDSILPYRMEGHVKLSSGEGKNMYGFWKNRLTETLINSVKGEDGALIHLSTEEYQHLFDWQRVRKELRVIQPLFYIRKRNDLKIQAVGEQWQGLSLRIELPIPITFQPLHTKVLSMSRH